MDRDSFGGSTQRALAAAAVSMAPRLADGATLWCVAPRRPEHARHLAVEFAHPVVVGKPAVPALSVDEHDLAGTLRSQVEPGDVVVAVGPADPVLVDLFARALTWGAVSVWIGAGVRPDFPTGVDPVWEDDGGEGFFDDGSVVLLYHLLWELAHVCMESGVTAPMSADNDSSTHCITCSDEAAVGELVAVGEDGLATARIAGRVERVDVSLIEAAATTDLVLVHAGTAIARHDPVGQL